jgi:catechol 2,3-dioxygenase-like lactoylglutathione lyase family enzyme
MALSKIPERGAAVKLNHVNLTVDDVSAARAFLEKHFGMRPYGEGPTEADVDEVNRRIREDGYDAPGGITVEVLC